MGPTPSVFALTVPTLVYLWQLPHFYGLAYWKKDDYMRGGFRMLPSVDVDGGKTHRAMTRACAGLAAWSLALPALGFTTWMFAPTGLAVTALQYWPVLRFGRHVGGGDDNIPHRLRWGKMAFLYSLASLPLMVLGMIVFGKSTDGAQRKLYVCVG